MGCSAAPISTIRAGPGLLAVRADDTAGQQAVPAAGVEVGALIPERASLEDAFLSLVEGDDVPR